MIPYAPRAFCVRGRAWQEAALATAKIGQPGTTGEVARAKRPTRAFNQRQVKGGVVHEITASADQVHTTTHEGRTVAVLRGHTN